jgi:hypothetical protein
MSISQQHKQQQQHSSSMHTTQGSQEAHVHAAYLNSCFQVRYRIGSLQAQHAAPATLQAPNEQLHVAPSRSEILLECHTNSI